MRLRLALDCGLILDQIDDAFSEVDTLSSAGSESISEFLKCLRENRSKDSSGPDAAFSAMQKFLGCLNPEGDLRHALTFPNEQNLPEGSVEYSAALKTHIAMMVDKEKKERVRSDKHAIMTVIQSEFPQYIQFLSSSSVEGREQIVQQATSVTFGALADAFAQGGPLGDI
ncbi:hypothetical protein AK812_SmicGene31093 [Symbiodinium microadriaticum]|uniref:Uncharacterized protein n=1 Tax=Symbiodinium microadriaticum TaxID=2951 RepID=A0A1Q9CXQ8_SYMMI|nr:hypothetical protein AK812_SmicGene31093 [Symbiodinium microadriaticum]